MRKNMKRNILIFIISFLVILFFSTSTSPLFENYYEDDSSIFILMGKASLEGKTLYKDIFDHKGPILFWIQALGQLISEGRSGIFLLQVISLTITNILWYKIANYFCNSKHSICSILVATSFWMVFFEEGNLSEELSLPFLSLCLFLTIKWIHSKERFKDNSIFKISFIYGVCFGIISLIRLNNTAMLCGLILGITIIFIKNKEIKKLVQCGLYFFAAIALVYIPVIIYFASIDALYDMIYGTFIHNFKYLDTESSLILKICYHLHMPVLIGITYKKVNQNKDLNLLMLVTVIITYIIVLACPGLTHYYTLTIPFIIFYIANFFKICEEKFEKRDRIFIYIILAIVCIIYSIVNILESVSYLINQKNVTVYNAKEIIEVIPEEERDEVCIYNNPLAASICLYGDIIPQNKYVFFTKKIYRVNPELYDDIYTEICNENTKWIISTDVSKNSNKDSIDEYIIENYNIEKNMVVKRQDVTGLVDVEIFLYKKLDK